MQGSGARGESGAFSPGWHFTTAFQNGPLLTAPQALQQNFGTMGDAIPVMNSINAPLELCEQVRGRFLQFLNNYVVADGQDDAQPSQSITHSQGSGAAGQGTLCGVLLASDRRRPANSWTVSMGVCN